MYTPLAKVYVEKGVTWRDSNSHYHHAGGAYAHCTGSLMHEVQTR